MRRPHGVTLVVSVLLVLAARAHAADVGQPAPDLDRQIDRIVKK
jgi:hypothetical protein